MKRLGTLFITALIAAGGASAAGAYEKFSLDKDHTYVGFNVSYLVLAHVSGQFDDFKGSFVIDRDHPENSRANIVIQTASIDTGVKARDADIRGPGLFNAEQFPTMTFHSNKIEMGTDNTGRMTGDLTLLGITKPVTLDLVKMPGENKSLTNGYKVTGQIKRSDFGMNAFIRPIGNIVTLLVCYNMEGCDSPEAQRGEGKTLYNQ
jgi:polyisoprenoid-binding protein YceI